MDVPTVRKVRRGVTAGAGPVLSCHTPGKQEGDASQFSTRGSLGNSFLSRHAVCRHPSCLTQGILEVPRAALWGGNECAPELPPDCLDPVLSRTFSFQETFSAAQRQLLRDRYMQTCSFIRLMPRAPKTNHRVVGKEKPHRNEKPLPAQGIWSEIGKLGGF